MVSVESRLVSTPGAEMPGVPVGVGVLVLLACVPVGVGVLVMLACVVVGVGAPAFGVVVALKAAVGVVVELIGGGVAVPDGNAVSPVGGVEVGELIRAEVGVGELMGGAVGLGGAVFDAQIVNPFSTWQLSDSTARSMASFSAFNAASKPLEPLPPAHAARRRAPASAANQRAGANLRRVVSLRPLIVRCISWSPGDSERRCRDQDVQEAALARRVAGELLRQCPHGCLQPLVKFV